MAKIEPVVLGIFLGAVIIVLMGIVDDLKNLDYRLNILYRLQRR